MKLNFVLVRSSSRLLENLLQRIRILSAGKGAKPLTAGPVVGHLKASTGNNNISIHPPHPQSIATSTMDLVNQINANHKALLERLETLESLVQKQNGGITSAAGDLGPAALSPPTDAEIENERLRLIAENNELRKQVDSLVRQLTALEVAVKGKDQVASLDLLPKRGICDKPAQPSSAAKTQPASKKQAAPPQKEAATNKENQVPKQQQEKKQKQPKQVKGESGDQKPSKAPAKPAAEPERAIDASRLDLRVGKIVDVKKHPDADSLYVEQIDCGEEKPRTVVSGLVKFVPIEQMQNRMVVILCNLKPAKMRGVLSEAMVMCASSPEKVEVLLPPEGAVPGDRVTFENFPGAPDAQLNPKKKIWEQIAPDLSTNDSLLATYKGDPFVIVGKGAVKSETLKNVAVK